MQRINTPDGQFHDGDPQGGMAGTIVTAAFLNSLQEEIVSVILGAGIELDAAASDQLAQSIRALGAGRLLRTTVYTNVGGTIMASINGAAAVALNTFTSHPDATRTDVEGGGAGGCGSGVLATDASHLSVGSGGGAGSYAYAIFGGGLENIPITVAPRNAAVAGSAGPNGGTTSFGSLLSLPGGRGGNTPISLAASTSSFGFCGQGGVAATPTGSNIQWSANGNPGPVGIIMGGAVISGQGGVGPWGGAGQNTNDNPGSDATGPCSGGGGAANQINTAARPGGANGPGILIVKEYA